MFCGTWTSPIFRNVLTFLCTYPEGSCMTPSLTGRIPYRTGTWHWQMNTAGWLCSMIALWIFWDMLTLGNRVSPLTCLVCLLNLMAKEWSRYPLRSLVQVVLHLTVLVFLLLPCCLYLLEYDIEFCSPHILCLSTCLCTLLLNNIWYKFHGGRGWGLHLGLNVSWKTQIIISDGGL